RALRVDSNRLVVAARPELVGGWPLPEGQARDWRVLRALSLVKPATDTATAHPDRITLQPDPVTARDGRVETPAVLTGIAEDAGHLAHGLALACLRAGIGSTPGAHVRLRVRVEHGKHEPVGQRAVLARHVARSD